MSWLPMKDVVRWPVRQTCWELAAGHEVEAQVWPHTTATTYEYTHSHTGAMSQFHLLKRTSYNAHEKVTGLIFNFYADKTIKCRCSNDSVNMQNPACLHRETKTNKPQWTFTTLLHIRRKIRSDGSAGEHHVHLTFQCCSHSSPGNHQITTYG